MLAESLGWLGRQEQSGFAIFITLPLDKPKGGILQCQFPSRLELHELSEDHWEQAKEDFSEGTQGGTVALHSEGHRFDPWFFQVGLGKSLVFDQKELPSTMKTQQGLPGNQTTHNLPLRLCLLRS